MGEKKALRVGETGWTDDAQVLIFRVAYDRNEDVPEEDEGQGSQRFKFLLYPLGTLAKQYQGRGPLAITEEELKKFIPNGIDWDKVRGDVVTVNNSGLQNFAMGQTEGIVDSLGSEDLPSNVDRTNLEQGEGTVSPEIQSLSKKVKSVQDKAQEDREKGVEEGAKEEKKTSMLGKFLQFFRDKTAAQESDKSRTFVLDRYGVPIKVTNDGHQLFYYVDGELIYNEPLEGLSNRVLHGQYNWHDFAKICVDTGYLDMYMPNLREANMSHPLYYAISLRGTSGDKINENFGFIGFTPKTASIEVDNMIDKGHVETDGDLYYLVGKAFNEGDVVYVKSCNALGRIKTASKEISKYKVQVDGSFGDYDSRDIKFAFYPRLFEDHHLSKTIVGLIPRPSISVLKSKWSEASRRYLSEIWDRKTAKVNYHEVCRLYNSSLGECSAYEYVKKAREVVDLSEEIRVPEWISEDLDENTSGMWKTAVEQYLLQGDLPLDRGVDYRPIISSFLEMQGGGKNSEERMSTKKALKEGDALNPDAKKGVGEYWRQNSPTGEPEGAIKDFGHGTKHPLGKEETPEKQRGNLKYYTKTTPGGAMEKPTHEDQPQSYEDEFNPNTENNAPASKAAKLPKLTREATKYMCDKCKSSAVIDEGLSMQKGHPWLQDEQWDNPDTKKVSPDQCQTKTDNKEASAKNFSQFVRQFVSGKR